jgi:hypothetical protein
MYGDMGYVLYCKKALAPPEGVARGTLHYYSYSNDLYRTSSR